MMLQRLGYRGTIRLILVIIGVGIAMLGAYIAEALVVLAGILFIIVGLYSLRSMALRLLNHLDDRGL